MIILIPLILLLIVKKLDCNSEEMEYGTAKTCTQTVGFSG
jgi:hypothetical protein